jgi:hypothetical protein
VAVVCCGDVYNSFTVRRNVVLDLRKRSVSQLNKINHLTVLKSRFSHIILFHERVVVVQTASAWLAHFFGRLLDPAWNFSIKKTFPASMTSLEGSSGIIYASSVETYLYRPGNFKSKPFGLPREGCLEEGCRQTEIRLVTIRAISPPSEGYELTYKCRRHQVFTQVFGCALRLWWPAGESGHIAVFDRILPVPSEASD